MFQLVTIPTQDFVGVFNGMKMEFQITRLVTCGEGSAEHGRAQTTPLFGMVLLVVTFVLRQAHLWVIGIYPFKFGEKLQILH